MKKYVRTFIALLSLILTTTATLVSCDNSNISEETTENEVIEIETTKKPEEDHLSETTVDFQTTGELNTTEVSHGHGWSSWNTIADATCSSEGKQERYCSCGEKEIRNTEKLAHIEVIDAAVPATCTADGKTEGKHCSVCEIVLVKQEAIPMLEHNYVNRVCSVCDYFDASEGLSYSLSANGMYYSVSGLGNCTDENIFIPSFHQGIPVTSIDYGAFLGCTNIISVTIPDGVTSIGGCAFYNCTSLKSINIPDSVTSIEYSVFYSCSSLTNITIPDGVTGICDYTFRDCTSLSSIIIPDSVASIDYEAFYGCKNLTNVSFKGISSKWNAVAKGHDWKYNAPFKVVHCSDGDVDV